jgi:hypothetical protein
MRRLWWAGIATAMMALGCTGCGEPPDAVPRGSAVPSNAVVADRSGAGDTPPDQAGNNGWKVRHELTAEERRSGQELAVRIRPKLEALRAAGDFTVASTRHALLELGINADAIEVTTMRPRSGSRLPRPARCSRCASVGSAA